MDNSGIHHTNFYIEKLKDLMAWLCVAWEGYFGQHWSWYCSWRFCI